VEVSAEVALVEVDLKSAAAAEVHVKEVAAEVSENVAEAVVEALKSEAAAEVHVKEAVAAVEALENAAEAVVEALVRKALERRKIFKQSIYNEKPRIPIAIAERGFFYVVLPSIA